MKNKTTNDKTKYKKRVSYTESQFPTVLQPSVGEIMMKLVSPRKILLTWEVTELPQKILAVFFQENIAKLVPLGRIYDVTDLHFTGKNAHHFFEIAVPYQNGYSFVKGLTPNRSYIAEIGVQLPGDDFFPFFRSNCLQMTSLDMSINNDPSQNFDHKRHLEEPLPKWREQVSTYSYYGKPVNSGDKHE